jgi:hypothetical protein
MVNKCRFDRRRPKPTLKYLKKLNRLSEASVTMARISGETRTGYFLNMSLNIHVTPAPLIPDSSFVIILSYHTQLHTISTVDTASYITEERKIIRSDERYQNIKFDVSHIPNERVSNHFPKVRTYVRRSWCWVYPDVTWRDVTWRDVTRSCSVTSYMSWSASSDSAE